MFQMNVYLNFHGNTMQAFKFYQSVFGGEFQLLQLMNGVPGTEKLSAEDQEKVMHISLPVGTNMMLHGTDTLESMGHTLNVGDNVHLMVYCIELDGGQVGAVEIAGSLSGIRRHTAAASCSCSLSEAPSVASWSDWGRGSCSAGRSTRCAGSRGRRRPSPTKTSHEGSATPAPRTRSESWH